LQADGRIIVGGYFSVLAGKARTSIGRLNSDGTADTSFFPTLAIVGTNVFTPEVQTLALQPDGTLLLGGAFSAVNGQPRASLARLNATAAGTQYLSSDGQSITWLRGGTTPEVSRTTFESSADGINWTSLGAGTRISSGWGLGGVSLSANNQIRARGFTSGSYYQGSGWFVENVAPVLARPTLIANDGKLGFSSSQFGFNAKAVPGQVVVIEATTDLLVWIPIQTNVVTGNGIFFVSDAQARFFAHRCYRARLYQGALPGPSLSGGLGFLSGAFGFNVGAVSGQNLVIEASTNLTSWTPVSTNTMGSGPLYFSDPASANFSKRFYRARSQ
jgi:hypothetical protein